MSIMNPPKHLKYIEKKVATKLKLLKKPSSELFETKQMYYDQVLKIYQEAFTCLIDNTLTYSHLLNNIKIAYENALSIRNERISQFITQDVYVLDGSFGSQVSRHVGTTADGDPLWSARFLQTHPGGVSNTHLDFLRAGADIISTNTYQASVGGFVEHLGVTTEEGYGLIRRAVQLAKDARDTYSKERSIASLPPRHIFIAGSVGPYGAHLHDGSEYSGSYVDKTAQEIMYEWHKPRIDTLVAAGVDILAFETIPCQKEAELLVTMLKEYPSAKAWISFSCKDDTTLAHGENFKLAARTCFELNPDQIVAVGVNCCSPKIVANLLRDVNKDKRPVPFVTYPNSGEKYSKETGWFGKEQCESLDKFVPEWLELGVRYVGGCCRTFKEDIAAVHSAVEDWREKMK